MSSESTYRTADLRQAMVFLTIVSIALPIGMSTFQALLNNYAVDVIGLNGEQNGFMQSLREVPGFLAFTAVFVLFVLREQTFAVLSLAVFGVGICITGFLPSVYGLYFSVVLMSIGFHYFETMRQSLSLQWLPMGETPRLLGRLMSIGAISSLLTFGAIWLAINYLHLDYQWLYIGGGGIVLCLSLYLAVLFPRVESPVTQNKRIVLRKRYWLYYSLTFLSGARRQIFIAFAAFLLVKKFGYDLSSMTLLMLINHIVSGLFAEKIGVLIDKIGERRSLTIEYVGLVMVFVSYAFVESATVAGGLYVLDHLLFAMAIALKTYFQKIADPADIASTASVSFTINHIAAVIVPSILGIIWMFSHSLVFLIGAGFALVSLLLSQNVPLAPSIGNETIFNKQKLRATQP